MVVVVKVGKRCAPLRSKSRAVVEMMRRTILYRPCWKRHPCRLLLPPTSLLRSRLITSKALLILIVLWVPTSLE